MSSPQQHSIQDQNGQLVFFGTKTAVSIFFNYLKSGKNLEDFLEDYPAVKINQVNKVLEMAEDQLNSAFSV
ncbi:DUF433 domain-containing protein [Mucilaginibacter sp.]|uniref:DUF433 domain-containing protein n=1 Tax=Mucilaginibacter sp. TaxID=1882438 RepID=UPI003B003758